MKRLEIERDLGNYRLTNLNGIPGCSCYMNAEEFIESFCKEMPGPTEGASVPFEFSCAALSLQLASKNLN